MADVGCGRIIDDPDGARIHRPPFGVSTITRRPSNARAKPQREPALDRCTFDVASAGAFGNAYDLVTFSIACTTWATRSARPNTLRNTKPRRHVDDRRTVCKQRARRQLNPWAGSSFGVRSSPASLSQEVGLGLGAQAGPARLGRQRRWLQARTAAQTPFNLVLEASGRPSCGGLTSVSRGLALPTSLYRRSDYAR